LTFGVPLLSSKKLIVSYIAGLVLFYFFVRNTDWASILSGARSVVWPILIMAILLRITSLLMSCARWQVLLRPVRDVKLSRLASATMRGATVSVAISMQAAEFVRPYLLSRSEQLEFGPVLSTVMVEWFLDLSAILTLFIPSLLFFRLIGAFAGMNQALMVMVFVSIAGLAALWALHRHAASLQHLVSRRLPNRAGTIVSEQLGHFAAGLRVLQQPRAFVEVSAFSYLISILTALSSWLALSAFGLTLPSFSAFVILGLISLGGSIPTPGAVGGFDTVCQIGLAVFFHVSAASAVLPVIGLHAVLYLPAAIVGLFYLSADTFRRVT
jgi:uncharacterized protein (TIRG00374 family)